MLLFYYSRTVQSHQANVLIPQHLRILHQKTITDLVRVITLVATTMGEIITVVNTTQQLLQDTIRGPGANRRQVIVVYHHLRLGCPRMVAMRKGVIIIRGMIADI